MKDDKTKPSDITTAKEEIAIVMASNNIDYSMIPISSAKCLLYNDDKTWSYNSELRTIMSQAAVSMKQQGLSIHNFDVSNDYACAFAVDDVGEFCEAVKSLFTVDQQAMIKVTADVHSVTVAYTISKKENNA